MLSAEVLGQVIPNLEEPVIFAGFQRDVPGENNPEFLRWGVEKFLEMFENANLPFRTGYNRRTNQPQWDVKCKVEKMTLSDCIEKSKFMTDDEWRYFDYKYMHEWLNDKPEILKSVDWSRFGFEKTGSDSTLWIGSKNAHTNCHQDSYGCNLVAQIHGKKQWLLFPSNSGNSMKPIRMPYEESTVYSAFNFFCPTKEDEEAVMSTEKNARRVVLEPGDVLLVPNGWWHYVESLDFSISINIWLPLSSDHKARVKEALVKLFVSNIAEETPPATEGEPEYTRREMINLLHTCIEEYKKHGKPQIGEPATKKTRMNSWTAKELHKAYPSRVKLLPELSSDELRTFLANQRERFPDNSADFDSREETPDFSIELINAICNYDVINKISNLLLQDE